MASEYTSEEEKELNSEFTKLKTKAEKLIFDDYYDHVRLSELQYSCLKSLTNANSHKDINWYLWNSGMLQRTLDYIVDEIKKAKKQNRSQNKNLTLFRDLMKKSKLYKEKVTGHPPVFLCK